MRFVLMVLILLSAAGGSLAEEIDRQRIEFLEQKVRDLEAQNRAILSLVEELREALAAQPAGTGSAIAAEASGPGLREAEGATVAGAVLPAVARRSGPAAPGPSGSRVDSILPKEVEVGSSRLGFYGFVRVDAIFDDSRPNHPQFPNFILSEDPSLGPPGDSQSNFHPRLTRFGMNYSGPKIGRFGKASLSGKIEIDFQNGGSESREVIRMRHAYLLLSGEKWSLLAGQTWDAFSPLYPTVNADSLMWNAGNLGDRRPQARVRYGSDGEGFSFVGGIGLTGAIDGQDFDGDGVRDGDDSSLPNFQARLGLKRNRFEVGLWGHRSWEETTAPIAGENDFTGHSVGVDFSVSLGERALVKGELWTGSNLSDARGGIGQGINGTTGKEIDSKGGWVELGLRLTELYSVYGGFTLDDPEDEDIPAGGRTENRSWYLVNQFRLHRSLLIGVDFLRWTTEYQGLLDGVDNRTNLYLTYVF